jgi:hypothetical protein
MKKVAMLEIADFDKIVKFITSKPINFMDADKALEIQNIIKKVKVADIADDAEKAS